MVALKSSYVLHVSRESLHCSRDGALHFSKKLLFCLRTSDILLGQEMNKTPAGRETILLKNPTATNTRAQNTADALTPTR